MNPICS